MKYPRWNMEQVDTGIRRLECVYVCQKDIEEVGGENYVSLSIISRRMDAITTDGDGVTWKDVPQKLFAGSETDCLAFINSWTLPEGSEILCRIPAGICFVDRAVEQAYFDKVAPLSDDGEGLAKSLNASYRFPDIHSPEAVRAQIEWGIEYNRSHPSDMGALTLKDAMKEWNMSQAELVRRTGVPESTIYKLVTGTIKLANMSAKNVQAIADALGCLPKNLLDGERWLSGKEET